MRRKQPKRRPNYRGLLLASAIALVYFAVLFLLTRGLLLPDYRLLRHGVQVEAVVFARSQGTRGGRYIGYSFTAHFFTLVGRTYTAEREVSGAQHERLRPGEHVPVLYLREDPDTNDLQENVSSGGVALTGSLLGVLALAGLLLFPLAMLDLWHGGDLGSPGSPAPALTWWRPRWLHGRRRRGRG